MEGSGAASHPGAIGSSPMARALPIAPGLRPGGTREVRGLWTGPAEGAQVPRARAMHEPRGRGWPTS